MNAQETSPFDIMQGLQNAFQSVIMGHGHFKEGRAVTTKKADFLTQREKDALRDPSSDPDAFMSGVTTIFENEAEEARRQNSILGIDTPCTHNGRLAYRKPDGRIVYQEQDLKP